MMNLLLLISLNEEYLLYMVEEGPTSSKLDHIVSIWRHPTVFSKNDILECDLEVAWDHVCRPSESRIIQLQMQFHNLRKGGVDDVSHFLRRAKLLADELKVASVSIPTHIFSLLRP